MGSRLSVFWQCQLWGWAAFVILSFPVKIVLFGSVRGALISLNHEALGFLFTIGMYQIYRRISYQQVSLIGIITIILILSLLGGCLESLLSVLLHSIYHFHEPPFMTHPAIWGVRYYRSGLLVCWSLLYFGLRLTHESIEKDSRLAYATAGRSQAELQMLRAQMNPHFLFNALNTIRYGIEKPKPEHKSELKSTVQSLADYLRFSLDHGNDDFVSLGEEYDAMLDYLRVEKSRFRTDLVCECHIDETLRSVQVPGIILQPLVENAIKYGRETSSLPLQVRVSVTSDDQGMMSLKVSNSGDWIPQEKNDPPKQRLGKSSHLGLQNLRRRLELLYPGKHSLEIESDNGWVNVNVKLPERRS
jgi:LytS/YehU family sensor histidine kinase